MIIQIPFNFDEVKYSKNQITAKEVFIDYNKEFLIYYFKSANVAFERLHKEAFKIFKPSCMDSNLPAVAMNSFIREEILKIYSLNCKKATRRNFKIIMPNGELAYIKKLNSKDRPSNIPTKSNDLRIHQCSTKNVNDGTPNIFLGYKTSRDNSRLLKVFAVCIDGDNEVWKIDLSKLAAENIAFGLLTSINTKAKTRTKLKEGTVKIKRKRK